MAKPKFPVEVLTPEGEVFNEEVEMISTQTAVGSIGILSGHQPLLAMLDPAKLELYRSDTDIVTFAQGEGFLQVITDEEDQSSHVLVLVDEAVPVDEINSSDIQSRLDDAEKKLDSAEDDSAEQREARRRVRRYKAFLELAGG